MPPDLFQMVHLKEDLELIVDAPVDLIRYHKHRNDYLKQRIEYEGIFV